MGHVLGQLNSMCVNSRFAESKLMESAKLADTRYCCSQTGFYEVLSLLMHIEFGLISYSLRAGKMLTFLS